MNKLVYLGLSVLDVSKIPMYEFWYDYLKPRYRENINLCYMDTGRFIFNLKLIIGTKIFQMILIKDLIYLIFKQHTNKKRYK